jgi:hypothetical protein
MAISEKLFPEGDLQNIIATSPTQKDYNIRATKDLVDQLPGGIIKDVLAPATAGVMSIPYDAIQAGTRITPKDFTDATTMQGTFDPADVKGSMFGSAYARENPFSSAIQRGIGAAGSLSDRFSGVNDFADIEGQTAFLDPVSVIVGAGKVAKGAGILDVMKNIFVNKARQKATSKAIQAAKDALAAKKAKEAAEAAARAEKERRERYGAINYGRGSDGQQSYDFGGGFGIGATTGGPVSNRTGRGRTDYDKGGSVKSKPEMKLDKAKRDSALYQGLYMMLEELPGIMSLFFKNGGVVKTDLTDTIPPERGPMSSGVESLFKRK